MARIAFITGMDATPWGGSEVLWTQAAGHVVDAGHDVLASVPRWPTLEPPLEALRRRGVVLDRRPTPSLWSRGAARAWRSILRSPHWTRSWQRIVDFRPDLVCISHGATTCGIDWMKRCLHEQVPYVTICQANYEFWWPNDEASRIQRAVFLGSRRTYFVSHRNRRLLETQLGTPLPDAEVVWNPFNVSWDAAPAWRDPVPRYKLACVARLEPRAKGHDLLFEVLAQEKWRGRPIEVTLFGAGPWRECVERLRALHHVEGQVHVAGHVADVERIWSDHHALIMPSRYEGLPLSLVEAMLCGRPAIVTDVAGNSEILEDDVTGFIARAPSAGLLDEAMERAWARRADWPDMGRRAAASIREKLPRDPAGQLAGKIMAIAATVRSERGGPAA